MPPAIGGSNRMIGLEELAEFLGIPVETVRKRWRGWGLPGVRIGEYVKFRERDVAASDLRKFGPREC